MKESNCIIIQKEDGNILSKYIKYGIHILSLDNRGLSSHGKKLYEFYNSTSNIDGDHIIRLAELQFELWDTLHNQMGITRENIKNIINVALEVPTSEASMVTLFNKINIYLQILNNDKVSLNESLLFQHNHIQTDDGESHQTIINDVNSHNQLWESDINILTKLIDSGPTPTYGKGQLSPHGLGLYNFYNNTPNVDPYGVILLFTLQYELWTVLINTVGLEINYRVYLRDRVFAIPTDFVGLARMITEVKHAANSLKAHCQDLSPTESDVANKKVIDEIQLLQHEARIFLKDSLDCKAELPLVIRLYGHYLCKYEALNLPVNNLVFLKCLKSYKKLINCIFIDYNIPANPNNIEDKTMNQETQALLNTVDLVLALQAKVKAYCVMYKVSLPEDIYTRGMSMAEVPVTAEAKQVNQLFEELKQFTIGLQMYYASICPFYTFEPMKFESANSQVVVNRPAMDRPVLPVNIEDPDALPPNPEDVAELMRTIQALKGEVSELLDKYFDLPDDTIRYSRFLQHDIPTDYDHVQGLHSRLRDFLLHAKRQIQCLPMRPDEAIAAQEPTFSFYPITLPDHIMAALEEFLMQPKNQPTDTMGSEPELEQLVSECRQLACQLDHYMSKYHANFSESLKSSFLSLMDSHSIALKAPTVPDMQGILNNLINFKKYLSRVYPTLIFEPIKDDMTLGELKTHNQECESQLKHLEMTISKCYKTHTEIRDFLINNQIPLLIKPYVQKIWDFTEVYLNKIDMNYINQYNVAYINELHSRLDRVLSIIYSPAVLNAPNVCIPDMLCLHTFDSYMIVAMRDCDKIWIDIPKVNERVWQDGIDINMFKHGPRVSDLETLKYHLGQFYGIYRGGDVLSLSSHAYMLYHCSENKSNITCELTVYLLELQIDLARLLSKPGIKVIDIQTYTKACTTVPPSEDLKSNLLELCKRVSDLKLDVTLNNYGTIERSLFLNL